MLSAAGQPQLQFRRRCPLAEVERMISDRKSPWRGGQGGKLGCREEIVPDSIVVGGMITVTPTANLALTSLSTSGISMIP